MISITNSGKLNKLIKSYRKKSQTIGFIPTMGALHQGHISLVKKARLDSDIVVVSIFVNPLQFSKGEDYTIYPRNFKKDKLLLKDFGVDIIFIPKVETFYPADFSVFVEEGDLSRFLCGKFRPDHFRGVCTVLTKLFNVVEPDFSYFGQKDYQQALIVKRLVSNLNFKIKIKILPIIREPDGLALSSRNFYLNQNQRKDSLCLHQALTEAKRVIDAGQRRSSKVKNRIKNIVKSRKTTKIDYIEIVNADNLREIKEIKGKILIALAVFIGRTRLIDNIILNV